MINVICSWCHRDTQAPAHEEPPTCKCGHQADVSRMDCRCAHCTTSRPDFMARETISQRLRQFVNE